MLKTLGRRPEILEAGGTLFAAYVRFVEKTTRWKVEPADIRAELGPELPVIMALWHGQHVFTSIAWPREWPMSALVARHADGEINAVALRKLGFNLIRGAGGSGTQRKLIKRGGMQALRLLIRTLKEGNSVSLTADVPKIGGVVGQGIVALAKLSGRPIYPLAVVTRRRIQFNSWDRATLSLPFNRGSIVLGDRIDVPADADEAELEAKRIEVGQALDRVHARAYQLAGGTPWQSRDG
ncbi:lysophospholipid acyltransferase family protein [Flaviflagellibacter deserti]|jgi:lysophospholipid acyltransferase (LPLAT)-like uncharacterized protein|uniref:Lysophospholipid acyltransferase family protein n=1 Tax=Flaviflagellibacter deserti TaxID=2267266 RepID=A0ABV9YYW0_9HYPH